MSYFSCFFGCLGVDILVITLDGLFFLHHLHRLHDDASDVVLVLDNDVEGVGCLAQFLLVVGTFEHRLPFAEDVERAHEQREGFRCGTPRPSCRGHSSS